MLLTFEAGVGGCPSLLLWARYHHLPQDHSLSCIGVSAVHQGQGVPLGDHPTIWEAAALPLIHTPQGGYFRLLQQLLRPDPASGCGLSLFPQFAVLQSGADLSCPLV